MGESEKVAGHAFISYVREDSPHVNQLQDSLEAAGIRVWRDTSDLWPGENWQAKIRQAIMGDALVFIACFSRQSLARDKSYQNEELVLAIEQLRLRRPDDPWLIPVRFDDCEIPDRDIGAGRTLASIQGADLFGDRSEEALTRLIATVLRILGKGAFPAGTTVNARQVRQVPDQNQKMPARSVGDSPDETGKDLADQRGRWHGRLRGADKAIVGVSLRRPKAFITVAGAAFALLLSLLTTSDGEVPRPVYHNTILKLTIDSPTTVPWCNVFHGTGKIPDGDSLLLFDSALGTGNQRPEFFYEGTAISTSRGDWSVAPVYIGARQDVGLKVELDGVLVTAETATFVRSVLAYPSKGNGLQGLVLYRALPPALASFRLMLTRNSRANQCTLTGN